MPKATNGRRTNTEFKSDQRGRNQATTIAIGNISNSAALNINIALQEMAPTASGSKTNGAIPKTSWNNSHNNAVSLNQQTPSFSRQNVAPTASGSKNNGAIPKTSRNNSQNTAVTRNAKIEHSNQQTPSSSRQNAPTASVSRSNGAIPVATASGSRSNGAIPKTNQYKMNSKANTTPNNSAGGSVKVTTDDMCWFFQRNRFCRYGENCKYSHDLGEAPNINSNSKGSKRQSTSQTNENVKKAWTRPKPTQISSNNKVKQEKKDENTNRNRECGICWENVLTKPQHERYFGLLSNCDHVFCYSCISMWSQSSQELNYTTYFTCPVCRVMSNKVTRSSTWTPHKKNTSLNTATNNTRPTISTNTTRPINTVRNNTISTYASVPNNTVRNNTRSILEFEDYYLQESYYLQPNNTRPTISTNTTRPNNTVRNNTRNNLDFEDYYLQGSYYSQPYYSEPSTLRSRPIETSSPSRMEKLGIICLLSALTYATVKAITR